MIDTVDGSYTSGIRAKLTKGEVTRVQRLIDDESEANVFAGRAIEDAYTLAERVFFLIRPAVDGDREAAADFWQEESIDIDDAHCLEAWCYGAAGYSSPE